MRASIRFLVLLVHCNTEEQGHSTSQKQSQVFSDLDIASQRFISEEALASFCDWGKYHSYPVILALIFPLYVVIAGPTFEVVANTTDGSYEWMAISPVCQLYPDLDDEALSTVTPFLLHLHAELQHILPMAFFMTIQKFQLMQNAVVRLVVGSTHFWGMTSMLTSFHWQPIGFQAQLKMLVITNKALYTMEPDYQGLLC